MGNDGGSIPGRKELVKEKKRETKIKTPLIDRVRANYCALSRDLLKKPIMACRLGNLYNKAAIISALAEKKLPKHFAHIRSLKDLKEVNACFKSSVSGKPIVEQEDQIICPITQTEHNGTHKFFMIWTCGCVMSERAVRELQGTQVGKSTICVNCNKPYTSCMFPAY